MKGSRREFDLTIINRNNPFVLPKPAKARLEIFGRPAQLAKPL
jgi:hypothetical protein